MYSDRELIRLAAHKKTLRRDIAFQRAQCTAAAAVAIQPLEWIDRAVSFWRRMSVFALIAAIPLGLIVQRQGSRRFRMLRAIVRVSFLVLGAALGISRAVKTRVRSSRSINRLFARSTL